MKNNQTIENLMQLIKGESSFWFNKSGLSKLKLNWQKEYFAVSVSESQIDRVKFFFCTVALARRMQVTIGKPALAFKKELNAKAN